MSPLLQKQVSRVGRRLFLQTLLDCLAWCWTAALIGSACWFLAQPYLLASPPEWLRWTVLGSAVGVATVVGVVLAVLWAPSRLATALALDERFGLRERITTSMTLPKSLANSPAGQALLEDAHRQVSKIDVRSRFPVQVRWTAALVPVCVAVLSLIAVFYHPNLTPANAALTPDDKKPIAKPEELAKKMAKLTPKPAEKQPGESEKSKELEKLEAELRDLVNKPRDTREQLRERAKEMTELETAIRNRENQLKEKTQAIKDQLKNIDRFNKQEGMTKELEKALEKGDFDKAKDEVEKLMKKMQEDKLDQKDEEALGKKLDELREKLERLSQQSDEKEKLQEMAKQGKLDPEQLQRELDNLDRKKDSLKSLEELAKQLKECKECMNKGDKEGAGEALKRASERLKQMARDDKELKDLAEKLDDLQDARRQAGESMDGDSQPVPGAGRRPEDKDGDFKPLPSRVKLDFDKEGKKEIIDFVRGPAYKKKSSSEIAGDVEQASQEAPEALERQRIPRAASDIARGYYEKLREQAEKGGKP